VCVSRHVRVSVCAMGEDVVLACRPVYVGNPVCGTFVFVWVYMCNRIFFPMDA